MDGMRIIFKTCWNSFYVEMKANFDLKIDIE